MSNTTTALLLHEDVKFEDATVYATGNAYRRCAFKRSTIILKGFPALITDCTFSGCVWHVDCVLHDPGHASQLIELIQSTIAPSLPAANSHGQR